MRCGGGRDPLSLTHVGEWAVPSEKGKNVPGAVDQSSSIRQEAGENQARVVVNLFVREGTPARFRFGREEARRKKKQAIKLS